MLDVESGDGCRSTNTVSQESPSKSSCWRYGLWATVQGGCSLSDSTRQLCSTRWHTCLMSMTGPCMMRACAPVAARKCMSRASLHTARPRSVQHARPRDGLLSSHGLREPAPRDRGRKHPCCYGFSLLSLHAGDKRNQHSGDRSHHHHHHPHHATIRLGRSVATRTRE